MTSKYLEVFDLQLDVSDREKLYNYKHDVMLKRHGKNWVEAYDEMDNKKPVANAGLDKLLRSKLISETSSQELSDCLEQGSYLSNKVLPIYCTGDSINGQIYIKLKEDVQKGLVKVALTVLNFKRETEIMAKEFQASSLKAGSIHKLPFVFDKTVDSLCSIPPLHSEHEDCHVTYVITCEFDANKELTFGYTKVNKGIIVQPRKDVTPLMKSLKSVSIDESVSSGTGVFRSNGSVQVHVSLPLQVVGRHDSLPVSLSVTNHGQGSVTSLHCRLVLEGAVTFGDSTRRDLRIKGTNVGLKVNIASGASDNLDLVVSPDFTAAGISPHLLPSSAVLQKNAALDMNYSLKIKIVRSGLHRGSSISIPIEII